MSDPSPSTAEQAYRRVKRGVLCGELEGGRMVSEGEVAAELECSRTPVREAFLRLEVEGWLRLYPKRGALVVPVAAHESDEVLDARVALEAHAATTVLSDPRARAELVSRLDAAIEVQDRHRRAGELGAFAEADADFHQLIADAGGNGLLSDFYRSLRERQQRMTAHAARGLGGVADDILAEHRGLRDLLAGGDADAFTRALGAHLDHTHRRRKGTP